MIKGMIIICIILISGIFIDEISMQDYCNIESCMDKSHTLCDYPSDGYGEKCGDKNIIRPGLTNDQKAEILNDHNRLRANVASGQEKRGNPGGQLAALNIKPLKWDDEIAEIAQRWANQCDYAHDKCRDVARFNVGQNIAYSAASNRYPNNFTSLIINWYDEVEDFNRNSVHSLPETRANIYHYTQLIWAETTLLGCGAMKYKRDNYWYTTYLVCNYGPAGNIIGTPVYKTV